MEQMRRKPIENGYHKEEMQEPMFTGVNNESTTDVVLQNKFYNVWDGKLPQVMGEGTVITNVAQ